jgi:hypothetical protein
MTGMKTRPASEEIAGPARFPDGTPARTTLYCVGEQLVEGLDSCTPLVHSLCEHHGISEADAMQAVERAITSLSEDLKVQARAEYLRWRPGL